MHIVLFGAPGAGKGTIAKKISEHFSIPHISTGDIFRDHIQRKTELGKKAKCILESGELIPDDLTTDLVAHRLTETDTAYGYILDGYPRTLPQVQWLDETHRITHYIVFDIAEDTLIQRLSGRRMHKASGRIYHIHHNPPKVAETDDNTGEPLIQREDDKPEKIMTRLRVYQDQTAPILTFIQDKSQCVHIQAEQSIQNVFTDVLAILTSHK